MIQEIVNLMRGSSSEADRKQRSFRSKASNLTGTLTNVVVKEISLLGKMDVCKDFQQWLGHFLTMRGSIGLSEATKLDSIVNPSAVPLPFLHPVRIIGNLSGILFMAGVQLAHSRRLLVPWVRRQTKAEGCALLLAMYGTGLTGFLVQWYADMGDVIGTS